MISNAGFELEHGTGWSRGLRPMLRRENGLWWRSRRWLVQSLLWTLLLNGLLFTALFVFPALQTPEGDPAITDDPVLVGAQLFLGVGMMALAVGAIILLQDTVLGEREGGTAEWVLSKPLSREAFILAKLVANLGGTLVTMILVPGLVGFLLFYLYDPQAMSPAGFAKAQATVAAHTWFYVTLTLMMGTLLSSRAAVLGLPFASLLGGGLVPIASLVRLSPWRLGQVALLVLEGQPLDGGGLTMIAATVLWSVLFVVVAVWRFSRTEI